MAECERSICILIQLKTHRLIFFARFVCVCVCESSHVCVNAAFHLLCQIASLCLPICVCVCLCNLCHAPSKHVDVGVYGCVM